MKSTATEIVVGIFILVGLLCVSYLTIKLGKMEILGGDYYRVTATFGSISGLKKGAEVELAGVQIGQVEQISLDTGDMVAVVRMKIRADVPLTDDAIASVKTSGLIGDKYVRISPGGSDTRLENGGKITETESAIDIEEMIAKYAFGKV